MSIYNDSEALEWNLSSQQAAKKLSEKRKNNDSLFTPSVTQNPTNDPRFNVPAGYRRENGRLVIDIPKQGRKPAPTAKSIESEAPMPDFGSPEETAKAMVAFWSEKLKSASSTKDSRQFQADDIESDEIQQLRYLNGVLDHIDRGDRHNHSSSDVERFRALRSMILEKLPR